MLEHFFQCLLIDRCPKNLWLLQRLCKNSLHSWTCPKGITMMSPLNQQNVEYVLAQYSSLQQRKMTGTWNPPHPLGAYCLTSLTWTKVWLWQLVADPGWEDTVLLCPEVTGGSRLLLPLLDLRPPPALLDEDSWLLEPFVPPLPLPLTLDLSTMRKPLEAKRYACYLVDLTETGI